MSTFPERKSRIALVGLGYAGQPLAACFSGKFSVVGFDISQRRLGPGKTVAEESMPPVRIAEAIKTFLI